jgi:hypothetical protein
MLAMDDERLPACARSMSASLLRRQQGNRPNVAIAFH